MKNLFTPIVEIAYFFVLNIQFRHIKTFDRVQLVLEILVNDIDTVKLHNK